MKTGRRLALMLVVLLAIGVPAVALSVACVGQSCAQPQAVTTVVPFCPLPADLRTAIGNGYYKGRSAEVFAVARGDSVGSWAGDLEPTGAAYTWPWPGQAGEAAKVPLFMWGDGIAQLQTLPHPLLSQIAPTLSEVMGLERPHPEVRSGVPIDSVASGGAAPRLVLLVGVKGGGGWKDWYSRSPGWTLPHDEHAGLVDTEADPGALPVDSAATLTTVGVGALPSEHGITGSLVRNDQGKLTQAWGPGAPGSTLATLAEDLLQTDPGAMAGMVGTSEQDRGLVGSGWYMSGRAPTFVRTSGHHAVGAFDKLLAEGYGRDSTPDLIAAAIPEGGSDARIRDMVDSAEAASGGHLTVVVFGTGSGGRGRIDATQAEEVVGQVEKKTGAPGIIQAAASGAFFLDPQVSVDTGVSSGAVVQALKSIRGPDGKLLFEDAFPAFSIQFSRFC